ncbi:MAG: hypothetical protein K6G30_02370 [Acetatifactor sp.]|nr:hypothetical protein [Acetatifactor sp.]
MTATDKQIALEAYKAAKTAYLQDMTQENWIAFCNAKMVCMRLGILL